MQIIAPNTHHQHNTWVDPFVWRYSSAMDVLAVLFVCHRGHTPFRYINIVYHASSSSNPLAVRLSMQRARSIHAHTARVHDRRWGRSWMMTLALNLTTMSTLSYEGVSVRRVPHHHWRNLIRQSEEEERREVLVGRGSRYNYLGISPF